MNHEECIDELEIRKNACMEDIREYRLEMMLRKVPEDMAEDGGILQFKETLGKDEVTPRFGGVTL